MTSRRAFLAGAALCPFAAAARAAGQVTSAPVEGAEPRSRVVSPFGPHQAGILTPRPSFGMIAAFDVLADTPADLEDLLRRLSARIVFLTRGGVVPEGDPRLPPADSGLLGPVIEPDALTVTVALGADLFERTPWLAAHRPAGLVRMTRFPNDALDADLCHGDLALQICGGSPDATIHALRDIIKALPDRLVLRWKQEGSVPAVPAQPSGQPVPNARNLLGFRDGSANPDAGDDALMDRILWAPAGWAAGGTMMAVRIIRNFVERWDRAPLVEQERIIGRVRVSGAPLDHPVGTEADVPDFAADPDGARTPLDAHIRLANPRTAAATASLILRRPFNYSNGVTKSGQLDQGLLFIAFQADLQAGFIAVQNRLNGEPLEEYVKPVGGGFFVVLPGFSDDPADFLGRPLIAALSPTPT